jgi:hypothetical protein
MNPDSHIHEDIPAYLAGELTESERQKVDLHLSQCSECSQELETQRKLNSILSRARDLSPRPELLRGVMNQVQAKNQTVPFKRRFIIPLLAAAAVIVIVLFLLKSQKDLPSPHENVKKEPIIKPEIEKQPDSKPQPVQPEQKAAPLITKEEKKIPAEPPQPMQEEESLELTPEEAEVVAQLDELEDMDIISNYENLENMEIALLGEGNESPQ